MGLGEVRCVGAGMGVLVEQRAWDPRELVGWELHGAAWVGSEARV